jgi:hypothetical protein
MVAVKPPAYTWIEEGWSCLAYDFVGDVWYDETGRHQENIYRLTYQIRHGRHYPVGQIERLDGSWVIRAIARTAIPDGESLVYPTWEDARDYLWNAYQESKVKRVAVAA